MRRMLPSNTTGTKNNATRSSGLFRKMVVLVALFFSVGYNSLFAQSPLCASSPTTFGYEYVSSITINGVTKPGNTGYTGPGYYDYTGTNLTNLVAGQTYPVSVVVQTNGNYQEYVKIWFDFNGNLNLQDAGELVFDQNFTFTGTHTYTGNITLPSNAYNGQVYIRVIMVYSVTPALCGSYTYGNTLDFKATISGGVAPSTLSVATGGTGTGSVVSSPSGINTASGFNSASFPTNSTVSLTATPSGTSVFSNWSGAVSSTSNPLSVTMDAGKSVTANFSLPLGVTTNGISSITASASSGGGSVTGDGGNAITARGVCWNTTGSPTTANPLTSNGTGTGTYTSSITGLLSNTTYYVRAYATNSTGTVYGAQTSFTTLPADPTSVTASPGSICTGNSATLTANGAQGTVYWYSGSCGGTLVGTGNSITVSPTSTTAYYARNNNGAFSNGCASATVTVSQYPTVAAITGTTSVCTGSTTQLNDATTGGTWSSSNTSVAAVSSTGLVTGGTDGTATITYTVTNAGNCTTSVTATVTVNALPVAGTSVTGTNAVCSGSTAILTASSSVSGGVYKWYDAATNGNLLFTGAAFTTPSVSANTTYYVGVTDANGCTTATTTAANVNIIAINNQSVSVGSSAFCGSGSTTVLLASSQTGLNYTLRNNANNAIIAGPVAGTGAAISFNTGTISATTTYNVLADNNHAAALNFASSSTATVTNNSFAMNVASGFTVEGWIYINSLSTFNGFASQGLNNIGGPFDIYVNTDGTIASWVGNGAASQKINSTIALSTGTWYHLACVYDASAAKQYLYINGVLNNSASVAQPVANVAGAKLFLAGRADNGYHLNGKEDDMRFWNTARTAAQISANMNACINTPQTGLYAYYKLDDAITSSTAADASGNGLNGTLNNFTIATAWTTGVLNCTSTCSQQMSSTPTVTINSFPTVAAITGTTSVCSGSTTQLNDATTGGTWSSSNTSVAAVNTSGLVTGGTAGTATITYTVTNAGNCTTSVTTTVTVNALPTVAAITGTTSVCSGSTTQLNDATTGGTWSSSNTSVASVNSSGLVTGGTAGTATITYTITNANNCTSSVTTTATVNALPTVAAITGTTSVCSGSTTQLNDATTGGVWSSSNTSVASVNASGLVTTATVGSATITYTVTNAGNCTSSVATTVTVNPLPTPTIYASGATTFCAGGSVTLNVSALGNALSLSGTQYAQATNANLPMGNTSRTIEAWVKTTIATNGVIANWGQIATSQRSGLLVVGGHIYYVGENNDLQGNININDGKWHHVAATFDGSTLKLYVDGVLDVSAAKNFNTTGSTFRIGQRAVGDAGSELYNGIMDELRIWNVARTQAQLLANRFAEIPGNSTGLVAYYKMNEASGLSLADATPNNITATLTAAASFIPSNAPGSFSTYLWTPGGATSSSFTATASGNYTVTVTDANSCSATSAPMTVTVNALPTVAAITGTTSVCSGSTTQLNDATTGGTWSSSNTSVAAVNTSGLVTGGTAGTATITYTVTNANNCTSFVTTTVTVNALPTVAAITGTTSVCSGSTTQLNDATTGGVWSSSNTSVASVNASGLVTGGTAGTATITYTVTNANNCTSSVTTTVTVNALPTVAAITGTTSVCSGSTAQLNDATTGGTWSSNNTSVASVNASGLVTGGTAGTATITYTITNANNCTSSVTTTVTVNALPTVAAITGTTSVCSGSTTQLNDATTGGNWSSSNGSVASVNASGLVTGGTAGTATITYTVTNANNCTSSVTTIVTVNALPTVAAITGTTSVCSGSTTQLNDATTGGSWSSSNGSVATVNASGLVTGGTAGTSTITYTVTNASNCTSSVTTTVTVKPLPTATTSKVDVVCPGASTGSITVTATSGTAPYQYSINGGSSYQSSNTFSGLTAGTYSVYIKDANTCANAAGTVTIAQVDNIVPTITPPSTVTVTLTNGNCTASGVALGTPVTADNCTVASVTNNAPATYPLGNTTVTWTVKDASSNTATATQTVTVVSPEINLTGNSVSIAKGDATPSTTDNTDFGGVTFGNTISKTFTIQNTGTSALTVSSINSNNAAFAVSGISFPATIAAGGNATFNVTFSSSSVGTQNGTITINNNDCDEASYDFAVKAQITCSSPYFANTNLYLQSSTSAGSCDAVVNYPLSTGGTPAPTVTYTFSGATTGTGSGTGSGKSFSQGITHVVVNATNACGTVSTAFDVTVVDDVKPIAVSKNITIYLDQSGHANFNVADLDNGSHDNCSPVTLSFNTGTICGTAAEGSTVYLQAPAGTLISTIDFASYGTPTGSCGNFALGNCNAYNSTSVVSAYALGQNSASIPASNGIFGDPCNGTVKRLYVQAKYGYGGTATTGSFTCANLGNNTVTYLVTDAAGNVTTATAIVTVVDRQGPTISAPDVYATATDPSKCGITVNAYNATATDCTPGNNTITYSIPTGSFFPIGTTPVTVTATDVLGNISTATFNVIVNDGAGPVITAPADITLNNQQGQCGAAAGFAATATDCTGVGNISYSAQPGSVFAIGTTQVTITATDVLGNRNTAIFNVTVVDNEPPVITSVPANISAVNDHDSCSAVVNYIVPVVTDNCGGNLTAKTFVYTGTQETFTVPAGVTSLTVDMSGAAGANGSYGDWDATGGAGARVQTVISVTPGQLLYLNVGGMGQSVGGDGYGGNGGYNGGGNGGAYSYYYYVGGGGGGATDIRNGGSNLTNRIVVAGGGGGGGYAGFGGNGGQNGDDGYSYYGYQPGSGATQYDVGPYGNSGGFGYGGTGSYGQSGGGGGGWYGGNGAYDFVSGGGGSSYVDPQASGIAYTTGYQPGNGTLTISWSTPVTLTQTAGLPAGAHFPVGITTNTFTATDAAGNTSSASFTVTVTDNQKPVIATPVTIAVNNDAGKCGATALVKAPSSTDNCGVASTVGVRSDALALTADYPVGITTIVWTVTDIHGNANTATQTVTVSDNEKPTITAAANQTQTNDAGDCGAVVTVVAPSTHDNCTVASVTNNHNNTSDASGHYPFGMTTIVWTVTDIHGNTNTATQTVTITDDEKPTITAAANQTQTADAGDCGAIVTVTGPSTHDNCAVQSVVNDYNGTSNASGHYPVGTTTIVWTVTDIHGNKNTATQTVMVTDNEKPTITAAANQTQTADAGDCGAVVKVTAPATHDNCTVASVTNDYNNTNDASGHYPVGTTTIVWTVTDIHGNKNTATQTVTVTDNEKPTITAAANQTQTNDAGDCGAVVKVVAPSTHDNCTVASVTNNYNNTSDASGHYPFGTTTIVWTVTDIHGNTNTATQTVTITDDEKPTIIAAANQTQTADASDCGAVVRVVGPSTHDNCGVASVTNNYNNTSDASGHYPFGLTTIVWTVTDIHGNTNTTTQTVTITDDEKPTITAAANQTQTADAGDCGAVVRVVGPSTHDNCGIASVTNNYNNTSDASGHYPFGTTTIVWTVTDIHGNTNTATQTVTITDDEKPVIVNLPHNMTLNALNNNCSTLAGWTKPTATDNCGIASIVSNDAFYEQFGFTLLSVGVNTITYTVTDIHGNQSSASFTVTVVDNQPPIITGCPSNITINAAAGRCDQVVNWNPPTASDNCPGVSLSTDHIQGSTFPVGATTVTYTATDHAGLVTTCSFTVTVVDAEKPTITAAANQTQTADAGDCGAVVRVVAPSTHDNCTVASVTNDYNNTSDASGHYPVGTTTITWTVTDIHGNTNTTTQTVTVTDNEKPTIVSAGDQTQTADGGDCGAVVTVAAPSTHDNCTVASVTNNYNNTSDASGHYPVGTTTIVWTVTDTHGNTNSTTQTVTVTDNEKPTITAAANQTQTNDAGDCGAVVRVAAPSTHDNCTVASVTNDYNNTSDASGHYPFGTTTIVWTVTDIHGNKNTTTQTVTITDDEKPTITAAANQTQTADAGDCGAVVKVVAPSTHDNCTVASVTNDYNNTSDAGGHYPVGTTTITWTVTDIHGNTNTTTQTVTVTDNEKPTIVSAGDQTQTADAGDCGAVVTVAAPSTHDNCTVASVTNDYNNTSDASGHYPVGATTITWTVTDIHGNTNTTTQTVTVTDNEKPTIVSAGDQAQTADAGDCGAVVKVVAPSTHDNCAVASVINNYNNTSDASGHYPVGKTVIKWTVTDTHGNTATTIQCITVTDNEKPTVSAAANQTQTADAGDCGAVVKVAAPSTHDNCTVASVTNDYNNTSDASGHYPVGTTTITWTVTDIHGNTNTTTQTVTITDNEKPTIVSAGDQTQTADGGDCGAVVTVVAPSTHDNCTVASVTNNYNNTSDASGHYPVGATTITWTVTDIHGNTNTTTQTVTVTDNEKPTIVSAGDQTQTADAGDCGAVVKVVAPSTHDNCAVASVINNYNNTSDASGHYPVGKTVIKWTVTDTHGNTATTIQCITITDNEKPTITTVAKTQTADAGDCGANVTVAAPSTHDNCAVASVRNDYNNTSNASGHYPVGTTTIVWTVTDVHGNTNTTTQTVTVTDDEKPVVLTQNVTLQLDANGAASVTAAQINNGSTDNCNIATVTLSKTTFDCSNLGANTVMLTVTDIHGNTNTANAVVTVKDTVAPVVTTAVLPDLSGECSVTVTTIPTAKDNCSGLISATTKDPLTYTVQGVYTIHWCYKDGSGNQVTQNQKVTVKDVTAPVPVIASLPTVTGECSAGVTAPKATDNCAGTVTGTTADPLTYTAQGTYIVHWNYNDGNGNTSTQTQTVIVKDVTAPVLTGTLPGNTSGQCLSSVPAAPAVATIAALYTDNCSGVTATLANTTTTGNNASGWTVKYLYTISDANGNSTGATITYSGKDNIAPVPTVASLPVLRGDCSVTATAPTAMDNCAGTITATTLNPTSYTAQGTYTITWSYSDGNGNSTSQQQTVIVKDMTPPAPTVAVLPTVTGQCSAVVTTKPTATDACSGVTAAGTTTDPLSYTVQGTYTIHWTYTDNYGNKSYQNQTVTVKDNIAPVPTAATLPTATGQCSAGIVIISGCTDNCICCQNGCHCRADNCNCKSYSSYGSVYNYLLDLWLSYYYGDDYHNCDHDDDDHSNGSNVVYIKTPTATDNCKGTITGTTTDPLTYTTQGTYTIHWNFDDGNGNVSVQTQTVIVKDNVAPVVNSSSLPTVYGTCSATVTNKPTAYDNCKGTITATTVDPLTYSTQGTFTIHWIYNDGNGNTTTQNQTVVISDNIKPVISDVKDVTVNCGTSTLPSVTGTATATDNCGTPAVTYSDVTVGAKTTRTWTATDAAGNTATSTQTITMVDNTKPVITDPADVTINCGSSSLPSVTGTATATDNCSTPTVSYSDNTNGSIITRTWKATDASGNYATSTQTITIVDNVKPVISAPSSVTISCSGSSSPSATGTATATDNCSTPSVTYSDVTSGNTITRTWKATDASGNYATATQTITSADNTAPVIKVPSNTTISCGSSTAPNYCGGSATATDNCSTPTITYSDVTNGSIITRTWKATDAAGNSTTGNQTITIVDNTKPVLTEPNDITINCGGSTLPAATGMATATDNCSAVAITYTDTQSGNVITRTWKATDASGNYDSDVQYITIGSAFTAGVTSVPTNSTYTGGVSTNLYLGYGAQSTTLTMCSLPSSGAPYSYKWTGSYTSMLSSTTAASPVFTPSTFGYYTFSVTVTNKYGCTSTASISICVTDIRVAGTGGAKVYVCHSVSTHGSTTNTTLQVALNLVSSHVGSNSCGGNGNDRLGSCDQSPCNTTVSNSVAGLQSGMTKEGTETTATSEEDLKVTVMPNPTTTFFTLKIESKYDVPVNMRVMDAQGRVIDAKSKIGANSTLQIGHAYSSGTYYAEFIQGGVRKVVQMVKGRG